MLKRLFAGLFAVAITGALALAASITITGHNTEWRNSTFQVGIPRISRDESITATASGSITTAYQLTAGVSYVTVVATAGDAVKLPSTTTPADNNGPPGSLVMIIINADASDSMNIFPFLSTDTINAGSAGAALALAAGKTTTCVVGIAGKWFCNLSA